MTKEIIGKVVLYIYEQQLVITPGQGVYPFVNGMHYDACKLIKILIKSQTRI